MSLSQFVAGYCAILTHLLNNGTNNKEVSARLLHLKSLMCFSHSYPWECVLNIHNEVLMEIERGNRKWGDSFSDIESLNLLLDRKIVTTKSTSVSSKRVWFCSKYQRGECTEESPHMAFIRNEKRTVKHICASCYLKDGLMKKHTEFSKECPYKKENKKDLPRD